MLNSSNDFFFYNVMDLHLLLFVYLFQIALQRTNKRLKLIIYELSQVLNPVARPTCV